jgi:hypothetical protein
MATIDLKFSFEVNGYVLGKWVIFIARDLASDCQKIFQHTVNYVYKLSGEFRGQILGIPYVF